ncbi:MAG: hypothetical protein JWN04_6489 [Myxococcaceae bacterium]|nr:hypothetical protein [Myxococcaceae bacterium]
MTDAPETTALSEADLIRRMLERDNHAWTQFLTRYDRLIHARIDSVLRRFSGPSYAQLERDEVYSVLVGSLVRRDMHKLRAFEIERGYRLSTWIALLASNAAWDHVRLAARRIDIPYSAEHLEGMPSGLDATRALMARAGFQQVSRAVTRLSSRDREFFELFYVRCFEPEEIAAKMRISVKTVYTKKHKLRARVASLCASEIHRGAALALASDRAP